MLRFLRQRSYVPAMHTALKLMVFTDLDGTLIDHHTYRWDAAQPALDALRSYGCALVLASSKTAAEINALRAQLGFGDWPAIVENGAGVLPPSGAGEQEDADYQALRSALENVPAQLRNLFRGFGDMSAAEVSVATGLSVQGATLAKQRCFSEPGIWAGNATEKVAFLSALQERGIVGQQGGRFLTLSFGGNKADRIKQITDVYQPRHTIALGDAPNDLVMLEATDFGVIVANPDGQPLPRLKGEDAGHIIRTQTAGPSGWNTAILQLMRKLDLRGAHSDV